MYHIFLIHSLVEEHLGCFKFLSMTNIAAMNIAEHMSLWHNWSSFGYIPKSAIAGSWGRLLPNFLGNCHTDIQRDCTRLHSHPQCRSVSFTPHLLQNKLSLVFLILVNANQNNSGIICSFDDQFIEFYVYFGDQPSSQCMVVMIFSHSVALVCSQLPRTEIIMQEVY